MNTFQSWMFYTESINWHLEVTVKIGSFLWQHLVEALPHFIIFISDFILLHSEGFGKVTK